MKKLLALLLALVLCFGVLIACDTPEESSSSSSSEESSTSTEGPVIEDSSSLDEESSSFIDDPLEIVYYDEIREFSLKEDAPEFKLCENYNDLLAVLEAPLENFDGNIFEENYVLMLKNLSYSSVSGYLGFTNVISTDGTTQILKHGGVELFEGTIAIEWHLQKINGREYFDIQKYADALIIIPKEEIAFEVSNIIIFESRYRVDGDWEIANQFD